jgi:DNA-binding NarL/FixJ family response regulator
MTKLHVTNILAKRNMTARIEARVRAVRQGLIDIE